MACPRPLSSSKAGSQLKKPQMIPEIACRLVRQKFSNNVREVRTNTSDRAIEGYHDVLRIGRIINPSCALKRLERLEYICKEEEAEYESYEANGRGDAPEPFRRLLGKQGHDGRLIVKPSE